MRPRSPRARTRRLVAAGEDPAAGRAMDLAEEHRMHIGRRFHACAYELHVCVGDMYVADERFTAYCDSMGEGVARHLRDAIHANAARHTG